MDSSKEIGQIRDLLAEKLDTENGSHLADQIATRASWQARVSTLHRDAESALDIQKRKVWGLGKTDAEKKINMSGMVADQQAAADKLNDLADILKQHVSLGQTLIKSMDAEKRVSGAQFTT